MIRSWRLQTLNGSAQPCFGDTMTAAFIPSPSKVEGVVTVADTTLYQVGDRFIMAPGQSIADIVKIDQVKSPLLMLVKSEGDHPLNAHSSTTLIALSNAAQTIRCQAASGNGADAWIGADNTVTNSGGGNVVADLIPSAVYLYETSTGNNGVHTDEVWMAGKSGDKIINSFEVL